MIFHQPHNSIVGYNYNAFFYESEKWEPHFHKNFELIYVEKGNIECGVNNNGFVLEKGQFGLCLPYNIHSIKPKNNARYWVMVFSEDFVRTFSKSISGKTTNTFCFECERSVHDFLVCNLINNPFPTVYMLKSCLYAVCNEFKNSAVFTETEKHVSIAEICLFIESNHVNDISLKNLADLLGYDYNYVSRYFHKTFNMSFPDLLNNFRLQTALELLEDKDKKIADVAFESGFKSVRNFNTFFKKILCTSPTQYRKNISK